MPSYRLTGNPILLFRLQILLLPVRWVNLVSLPGACFYFRRFLVLFPVVLRRRFIVPHSNWYTPETNPITVCI